MNLYFDLFCDYNILLEKEKQNELNGSSYVITDLFGTCLNTKFKGLRKVVIQLVDDSKVMKIYEPHKISPIASIFLSFDFDNYFAQSKQYRRKIILETLYDAIKEMCQKMNLDLLPFTIAYEKVKELNYENKFIYGKLTSSPNRKYKAGIEIEIIEEKAILSAVLNNGTEKSQTIKFLETLPHQMFIYRLVHKGKWTSKDIYTVSDKSRQINFDILFKDNTSKIRFEPKTATIEDLQKALKSVRK